MLSKIKPGDSTHGLSSSRIYNIWRNIKARCNNKNNTGYNYYGGRGITYDSKWEKFEGFYKDMIEGYSDNLTIDRIDNNGNYCKENCRWITNKDQQRNKRNNIIYKGKCLSQWCELLKLDYNLIKSRIHRGGLIEKILKQ